ncbi:MAG: hypothetical protein ACT4NY_02895 [Pseudonocardiales bacterium]
MSDIDIELDQLGEYPATLTGMAGHTRELAAESTAFTSTTGREDSATAAGLAEHLDALLGDLGTALDHDAGQVNATRDTLLAVDRAMSDIFGGLW